MQAGFWREFYISLPGMSRFHFPNKNPSEQSLLRSYQTCEHKCALSTKCQQFGSDGEYAAYRFLKQLLARPLNAAEEVELDLADI